MPKDIVRRYQRSPPEPWPICQTCEVLTKETFKTHSITRKMERYHVSKYGGVFGGKRFWYKCIKGHKAVYEVAHKEAEAVL